MPDWPCRAKFKVLGAQEGFKPQKYFSIDRVFRNEAVDRTHLAEFHQVEGVVCDRNLSLGHLMGVIRAFFERIGMPTLRFKPAFNPYTEPSMEIFSYHPGLGKWVEVGNSGVFRPEMLRPMGLPDDVTVIAWGLSLERPTMILYGIDNIRDLFGHKVDLQMTILPVILSLLHPSLLKMRSMLLARRLDEMTLRLRKSYRRRCGVLLAPCLGYGRLHWCMLCGLGRRI